MRQFKKKLMCGLRTTESTWTKLFFLLKRKMLLILEFNMMYNNFKFNFCISKLRLNILFRSGLMRRYLNYNK